jgi:hypothetical protein
VGKMLGRSSVTRTGSERLQHKRHAVDRSLWKADIVRPKHSTSISGRPSRGLCDQRKFAAYFERL